MIVSPWSISPAGKKGKTEVSAVSGQLTYENWDQEKVRQILEQHSDYLEILKWALEHYHDEIIYACSFGAEGMVMLDILSKLPRSAPVIFLDTGLHFPETYQLIEKAKRRYPSLKISMVKPKLTLEEQKARYGDSLWKKNPDLCCHIRKVLPMQDALKNAKAWISGLRREQSPSRKNIQFINRDEKFKKIKICPLIHWTWEDILTYIRLHKLPYNPLHDRGYPSIGCAPCTRPVSDGEDFRAGRWSGHNKTECGLHGNE